jgi:hypothetical protein
MRSLARVLVVGALVLGSVWACGSSEEPASERPAVDAGVDPAYCTKYCAAQSSAGTLQGTREECEARCCKSVPAGCRGVDGSAAVDDAGTPDDASTTDGATCARPCGSACCGAGEGCGLDGSGQPLCVKTCSTGADCTTGCCAPATNAAGDPVGPYVCKPNDGKAYHCCSGIFNTCDTGCCVSDARDNYICATKCTGNDQCGAAHCVGFNFGTITTSCSGTTACGP